MQGVIGTFGPLAKQQQFDINTIGTLQDENGGYGKWCGAVLGRQAEQGSSSSGAAEVQVTVLVMWGVWHLCYGVS